MTRAALVALALLVAAPSGAGAASRSGPRFSEAGRCTPPQVTCREFCRRHPEHADCMIGAASSCSAKPDGAATCVE